MFTRMRLQRAAVRFAAHGWPVTPGAFLTDGRFDCGRAGCPTKTCHPALEHWADAASDDVDQVSRWWRFAPHSVLLVTGHAFDVLEVPAPLGALAVGAVRRTHGPVAATPSGRWMLLVRPGVPLLPELDRRLDVIRHARGSWVPAPPSRTPIGPVRWTVSPQEVGWRLPDSYTIQQLLADTLARARVASAESPAGEPAAGGAQAGRQRASGAQVGGTALAPGRWWPGRRWPVLLRRAPLVRLEP